MGELEAMTVDCVNMELAAEATAQYVIDHFQPGRALPCREQAGQAANR